MTKNQAKGKGGNPVATLEGIGTSTASAIGYISIQGSKAMTITGTFPSEGTQISTYCDPGGAINQFFYALGKAPFWSREANSNFVNGNSKQSIVAGNSNGWRAIYLHYKSEAGALTIHVAILTDGDTIESTFTDSLSIDTSSTQISIFSSNKGYFLQSLFFEGEVPLSQVSKLEFNTNNVRLYGDGMLLHYSSSIKDRLVGIFTGT